MKRILCFVFLLSLPLLAQNTDKMIGETDRHYMGEEVTADIITSGGHWVQLKWYPPSKGPLPSGYNVYRANTLIGPYSTIARNIPILSYADHNVLVLHTYYYATTSLKNGKESKFSNKVKAVIP